MVKIRLCIVLMLLLSPQNCLAELRAVFLDVGAADCTLIAVDGEYMLIDTGHAKTWQHVYDVLTMRDVTELRYMVITHPHLDHMGAVPNLLEHFPVAHALLPPIEHGTKAYTRMTEAIKAAGITTTYPRPGDSFTLGAADITVYAPHPVAYDSLNNWSIVLMVKYAGRSILLAGDAEAAAEADMLAYIDILPLKADILKVAHHGSDSSSTFGFVEAVRPQYAIVSCDSTEDREYPSVETAMTLYDCGVESIFMTEKHGDVTVVIEADGAISVTTEK